MLLLPKVTQMHFCQKANKNAGSLRLFALLQRACSAIAEVYAGLWLHTPQTADIFYIKSAVCNGGERSKFSRSHLSAICHFCAFIACTGMCHIPVNISYGKITTGSFPVLLFHRDISCVLPHAPAPFLRFCILCNNSA